MVQPCCSVRDLMVVNVVPAGGGTIIHHQIILFLRSVPFPPILRIAMFHYEDASSTGRGNMMGEARRLLVRHHRRRRRWRHEPPTFRHKGSLSHAQVAAATVDTAVHAAMLRAAVVVTDAFGGGAAQLVELLEILGHGGVIQVAGWGAAQSAELVVGGFKAGVEEGRVEVISMEM